MDIKLECASLAVLLISIVMLQILPRQIRQHSSVLKALLGMNLFFILFDLLMLTNIGQWETPTHLFRLLFVIYYLLALQYPASFLDFIYGMTVVNTPSYRRLMHYVPAVIMQIVILVIIPFVTGFADPDGYIQVVYEKGFYVVMLNWLIYNLISLAFYVYRRELIGFERLSIYGLILTLQVVTEVVEYLSYNVAVTNFCLVYVQFIFFILFFYVDKTYDSLTGIYSENGFYRVTKGLLSQAKEGEFVLVHVDFHRFCQVNERYGDKVGDDILRIAACEIQDRVSGIGTYGRLHADDFLMCLPEKYFSSVPEGFCVSQVVPGAQMVVPAFYGVYRITNPDMPIKQICDRAQYALNMIHDQYMQHVVYFTEEMEQELSMEHVLEQEMIPALKDGQFELYYQPIINVKTRGIVSAEALVRWNHPEWGMIAPNRFVPLFERNGFITELDRYVLRQVCRRQSILSAAGSRYVPVSVNVSRKDLEAEDFAEQTLSILKEYQVKQEDIKFEITESSFSADVFRIEEKVAMLRESGYKIMMDDFGSGYSSFNAFGKLPVDVLKIDMLFIRQSVDERGKIILRSVVDMAKALHIPVVAEGAETREQVDFLDSLGVEQVQGFYFAKPMRELEFDRLLNQPGNE